MARTTNLRGVITTMMDSKGKVAAGDFSAKLRGEIKELRCRFLPVDIIYAVTKLKVMFDCREIIILTYPYATGTNKEAVAVSMKKFFPNIKVTFIAPM
jgi:hypothetical protein